MQRQKKKIVSVQNDQAKLWNLINLYINKSKKEKNSEALLYAYRFASNYSIYPTNLKYADSALNVAKKSQNAKLLTIAYLNRGIIYMDESKHQKALDDILIANQYSLKIDDEYFNNKTKYYMAQNKIYLGLYEEANLELKHLDQIKFDAEQKAIKASNDAKLNELRNERIKSSGLPARFALPVG